MSILNISDFDGTITTNSLEIYKKLFEISADLTQFDEEDPKTAILECMEYIKNNDTDKYLSKVKENLEYREKLIKYFKNRNLYIISDNPFVNKLIPLELNPIGVYPTIIPEIVGGKFTGRILEENTKIDIVKKQLPEPNGDKIYFHTDGGPSDEALIEYLNKNYEKVKVFRY